MIVVFSVGARAVEPLGKHGSFKKGVGVVVVHVISLACVEDARWPLVVWIFARLYDAHPGRELCVDFVAHLFGCVDDAHVGIGHIHGHVSVIINVAHFVDVARHKVAHGEKVLVVAHLAISQQPIKARCHGQLDVFIGLDTSARVVLFHNDVVAGPLWSKGFANVLFHVQRFKSKIALGDDHYR